LYSAYSFPNFFSKLFSSSGMKNNSVRIMNIIGEKGVIGVYLLVSF